MVHAPTDSCGGRPRRLPSVVVTSAAAIWSLAMTHIGNERVGWDVGVLVEVAVPTVTGSVASLTRIAVAGVGAPLLVPLSPCGEATALARVGRTRCTRA